MQPNPETPVVAAPDIFVGGSMRGGTTLVQRLLCTAPEVNDWVPEVYVLRDMVVLYRRCMSRPPAAREPFFADADECTRYFAGCVDGLLQIVRDRHSPDGRLVLKNPELTLYFSDLAELRPTAQFVIVIRDPRDVVASMKVVAQRAIAAGEPLPRPEMADGIEGMAGLFLKYYANVIKSPLLHEPDRLMFIRYEDLVTDTTAAVAKLSHWTGLNIRPDAVGSPHRGDDGTVFGAKLYGKPISNDAIGNFRNRLEPAEIAAVESMTAEFMKTFLYALPVGS